jgi:hypothetical protein
MSLSYFDKPGTAFDQPWVSYDGGPPVPAHSTHMAKVKLGLSRLTEDEVLDLSQTIITSLTGNVNFPTPNPALVDVTATLTAANIKKQAADLAHAEAEMKTTEKDAAMALLGDQLGQLAAYVDNASDGDAAIIESAGMSVRSSGSPVGLLPAPVNLLVLDGGTTGKLNIRWKAVPKARSYKIRVAIGETPANWQDLDTCTKAAYSATGLVSGTKYWFIIAAVSSAGTGGWSDPACKVAP